MNEKRSLPIFNPTTEGSDISWLAHSGQHQSLRAGHRNYKQGEEKVGFSFSNRAGTYVECPLHGRNLFREQDDIEGIHLHLQEVDGPIPRIPASRADVFRSSVRHCIIELRISQDTLVVGAGPTTVNDSHRKASRARLSDGRWRPPAARRDRRDKAETILWRRFRSGPVIIVVEVKRGLGASCFVPC